jgi:nucleoside 2-deoxyribosyltransferase
MNKITIFLSGPMEDMSEEKSKEWRKKIKEYSFNRDVIFIDPTDEVYWIENTVIDKDGSSCHDIVEKNFSGIRKSDIVIFNFSDEERMFLGTMAELTYSYIKGIPSIVFCGENRKTIRHPFINSFASHLCKNIEDCIKIINYFS